MTSTNAAGNGAGNGFGTNSWLVDEMYEQYVDDPDSVTDAWREFFADYRGAAVPAGVTAWAAAPAHVTETVPPVSSVVPSQSAPAPAAAPKPAPKPAAAAPSPP